MKLERYLSIPHKNNWQFVCLIELVFSMFNGILLIILHFFFNNLKNQKQSDMTNFYMSIVLLLFMSSISKLLIGINYLCRIHGKYKSHLQNKSKITICQLFIPTIVKIYSSAFLMGLAIIFDNTYTGYVIIVNLIVVEIYDCTRRKKKVTFKSLVILILMTIAYGIKIPLSGQGILLIGSQLQQSGIKITNQYRNFLIFAVGSPLTLISHFQLQSQLYTIYKPAIDELVAKQLIIEIGIVGLIFIFGLVKENILSSCLFIFYNPVFLILFIVIGIFYEYIYIQMLHKLNFKQIFFSQCSSIIWFSLYKLIKQPSGFVRYYFSFFTASLSFILLLKLIDRKFLKSLIEKICHSRRRRTQLAQENNEFS